MGGSGAGSGHGAVPRRCHHGAASPAAAVLRTALAFAAPFAFSSVLHLSDVFIGEHSRLRLFMLRWYARYEVQLLKLMYRLIHGPLMYFAATRKLLWHTLGRFMEERAIVGENLTLEDMREFIRGLPEDSDIAVGPCRCRVGHRACEHPVETDIVILTGAPIWLRLFPRDYRVISREEALDIVERCAEMGMVQSLFRHMYFRGSANYFVICNCCSCGCLPVMGYRVFKREGYRFLPPRKVAEVRAESCRGCGTCVEACPFGERRLSGGRAVVGDCQGCGVCSRFCPYGATAMVPGPRGLEAFLDAS